MASRVFRLCVLLTVIIRTAESSDADFERSIAASGGAYASAPPLAKSAPPQLPLELPYTFAEQPADVVVRRNATAELRCAVHVADDALSNNVSVWWSHDGLRIPLQDLSGKFNLLPGGNLLIHQVTRSKRPGPSHQHSGPGDHGDQGTYRCMIQGPLGTLRSQPARLTLATLSHDVTVKHSPEKVRRGGTARLECFTESDPPAQLTWERADALEMPPNRYIHLPGGILLITDVQSEDATAYRCVAFNHVLNKTRKSATVPISLEEVSLDTAAKFLSAGRTLHLKAGENASLECSVEYATVSVPMKWSFINKKGVKTAMTTNWTARGVSVLHLTNISPKNSGSYECSYAERPQSQNQVIILNVSAPPVIVKPPQSMTSPAARTARFPCEASGVPTPNVTFFKDGVRLKTQGRIKVRDVRTELVLADTVKNDSGLYQCVATNEAGEVSVTALLMVLAMDMEPPTNLSCSPGDEPDTIDLSWTGRVSDNQKAKSLSIAYTMHYTPTDGGEEKTTVVTKPSGSIHNLQPFTTYSIYVRSYTSGASEPSPQVICQTGETVPTDIPYLTVHLTGSNNVHVSWEPLPPSIANGVITEYQVMWRTENDRPTNASIPGNSTEYVIEGLQPGKKYDIRVLPGTKKGFLVPNSNRHNWTSIEMPIFEGGESTVLPVNVTSPVAYSGNPDTPVVVELLGATPYSLDISWNAPEPTPIYYSVYYCLFSSKNLSSPSQCDESTSKIVRSNRTRTQLSDLSPASLYVVKIKAYYEDGLAGPTSNLLECRTFPDSVEIYLQVVNDTSVIIRWNEPDGLNGTLKGYNVTCGTDFDLLKVYKSIALTENETMTVVDGLTPGVQYVVQVVAMVTAGTGPSALAQFTTPRNDSLAELGFLLLKVVPVALCVLACAAYSLYRCRCLKSPNTAHLDNVAAAGAAVTAARLGKHYGGASGGSGSSGGGSGGSGSSGGNGGSSPTNHVNGCAYRRDVVFGSKTGPCHKDSAEAYEMTLLSPPVTSSFPSSVPTPAPACHIDSKGAPDRAPEDTLNALTVPLLNGSAASALSIHITENPQFDSWATTNRPNVDQNVTKCAESVTLLLHSHSIRSAASETGGSETSGSEQACENEDDDLNETQLTDVEKSFQLHHNNNKSSDDVKLPWSLSEHQLARYSTSPPKLTLLSK